MDLLQYVHSWVLSLTFSARSCPHKQLDASSFRPVAIYLMARTSLWSRTRILILLSLSRMSLRTAAQAYPSPACHLMAAGNPPLIPPHGQSRSICLHDSLKPTSLHFGNTFNCNLLLFTNSTLSALLVDLCSYPSLLVAKHPPTVSTTFSRRVASPATNTHPSTLFPSILATLVLQDVFPTISQHWRQEEAAQGRL